MIRERGQASVELLGTLPAVLLVGALLWQLALAGHSAWLCANAARAGARAKLVGRSAPSAARSALPASLRRGMRVQARDGGAVRVSVRIPLLLRSWHAPLSIAATSRLGDAASR